MWLQTRSSVIKKRSISIQGATRPGARAENSFRTSWPQCFGSGVLRLTDIYIYIYIALSSHPVSSIHLGVYSLTLPTFRARQVIFSIVLRGHDTHRDAWPAKRLTLIRPWTARLSIPSPANSHPPASKHISHFHVGDLVCPLYLEKENVRMKMSRIDPRLIFSF